MAEPEEAAADPEPPGLAERWEKRQAALIDDPSVKVTKKIKEVEHCDPCKERWIAGAVTWAKSTQKPLALAGSKKSSFLCPNCFRHCKCCRQRLPLCFFNFDSFHQKVSASCNSCFNKSRKV